MEDAYSKSPEQVLKYFKTSSKHGLTHAQVLAAQEQYGKNEIPDDPPTPLWKLVLEQFQDQLVIILLLAAIVSFVLALVGHEDEGFVEPIVILLILIANAVVGVVQESNAEKAIEALKQYSPDEAKVFRDGHLHKLAASELVPGDIIDVSVGDKIPADARVLAINSSSFRVDQSILTGESVSVSKQVEAISGQDGEGKAVKQDMTNMLFSGTTVSVGKARALVVLTGQSTAIGDIHRDITSQISEKTPLKQKLDEFGDSLAKVISVICVLVWLINIRHFWDPVHHSWIQGAIYYFKIAVALAVAAIPEGLAVVITTCLALGTKKMAQKNAIVRSLPSVETLGCTSVICSDKTGTLTTNQMSVSRVCLINDASGSTQEFDVEGSSYAPQGKVCCMTSSFEEDQGLTDSAVAQYRVSGYADLSKNQLLEKVAEVCSLCNDASVEFNEATGTYVRVGEPTEAALRVLVEKLQSSDAKYNSSLKQMDAVDRCEACNRHIESKYDVLATMEFSRDRKSMSVIVQSENSKNDGVVIMVKGAPESILERCTKIQYASQPDQDVTLTSKIKQRISEVISQYGQKQSLRVLGVAIIKTDKTLDDFDLKDPAKYIQIEQEMTFLGLVAMADPPRPEVKDAIKICKQAGIRVVVITGDNKNTAESICRQIGIFGANEDLTGKSYSGREWDALSASEKKKVALRANLFSRTEPSHKSQLVDVLQSQGFVVAMTGDGVNDASALKKADIGIAMGSGTDVSKLAADMVLADDNFSSIVAAVEEGRCIYSNTRQFIRYLISSNIGEVVSIFITTLLGLPEALIPVQLLWVNLVTDGLPATALGFNPPDHDLMHQSPRSKDEPIVTRWLFIRYMVIGVYVGCATVFGYAWWFMFFEGGPKLSYSQLANFHKCQQTYGSINGHSCNELFGSGSWMTTKGSTMSLSILVVIEMLNAMNSLAENESLLTFPPWKNLYLIMAIALSMTLHFMILYVPFFSSMFSITALTWAEWMGVINISVPVLFIDEVLKWISRNYIVTTAQSVGKISAKDGSLNQDVGNDVKLIESTSGSSIKRKGSLRNRKSKGEQQ
ncbi:hypothetical protein MIR68_004632 [Amoeboaphelidium protococcarum]|nr:hypothetical protein MIR68_004632 [Amoeboaphelidium protococcarum]